MSFTSGSTSDLAHSRARASVPDFRQPCSGISYRPVQTLAERHNLTVRQGALKILVFPATFQAT